MPAKKLPEIIVFAGPNGSGKSTITRLAKIIEPYINADDIKRTNHCTDLEAAQMAEAMREKYIKNTKVLPLKQCFLQTGILNYKKSKR